MHHLGGHGAGYLAKLLVNQLWFGQAVATAEALLLGQAGWARCAPASPTCPRPVRPRASSSVPALPALLEGNYLTASGSTVASRSWTRSCGSRRRLDTPFELSAGVAAVHRAALDRFGPVDGELLAAAHLEQIAGRKIARHGTDSGG